MPKCERYKNWIYVSKAPIMGVFIFALNGQSAAKPRIEEGSTTILMEYICKWLAYGSGGHPMYF